MSLGGRQVSGSVTADPLAGGNYKGFFHVPRALLESLASAERFVGAGMMEYASPVPSPPGSADPEPTPSGALEIEMVETAMPNATSSTRIERIETPKRRLASKVPFRVPRRAAELTADWLTTALRFQRLLEEGVSVSTISHKPIGDGVMGDISAISITYSAPTKAPPRLIAKFSPVGKAPVPLLVVRAVFTAEVAGSH